jgi:uncharacterized membrane protein
VIWVIGASMVVLAALVHLPRWAIAATAIAIIAGHILLDGLRAEHLGSMGWLWKLLHQPGMNQIGPGAMFYVLYTLVPWVGVIAAGYALGPVLTLDQAVRRRLLVGLGLTLTAGFIVLHATNLYGDPAPWTMQSTWTATVLSFLNCEKYPASLLYLLMTLGPALVLLAAFAGARGRLATWITTFGRVPFLYYVAHLFLIHLLAVVYALAVFGDASIITGVRMMTKPAGYGLSLLGNYVMWMVVVVSLYPLCRWFRSGQAAPPRMVVELPVRLLAEGTRRCPIALSAALSPVPRASWGATSSRLCGRARISRLSLRAEPRAGCRGPLEAK